MTTDTAVSDFIRFEQHEVGQVREFGAYQVTEAEIIEFAGKYDPQFFHLEREAAKDYVADFSPPSFTIVMMISFL